MDDNRVIPGSEDTDSPSVPADTTWYGQGSWATDPRYSIQEKIVRWQFWTLMRQRHISWGELREELGGISGARLGQMLKAMTESDLVALRLEGAIDSICQHRHAEKCGCDEPACVVYTNCYEDDSLVFAKKGEIDEWRKWNAEALTESTQTA